MRRVFFEHIMNVIALSVSLYLTADTFNHTEVEALIMFSGFVMATHLYISPLWSKNKRSRRKGDKQ